MEPQKSKYGEGKKVVPVTVVRGGKTFKRRQLVGFSGDDRFLSKDEVKETKQVVDVKSKSVKDLQKMLLSQSPTEAELALKELKLRAKNAPKWYSPHHSKYNIKPLPVGIKQADVEINTLQDVHSGWYMKWKDQKTGADKYAYTSEYYKRQSIVKFSRVAKLPDTFLSDLSSKAVDYIASGDRGKIDSGIALYIMAKTGLRVGNESHKDKTGNEGLTTLSNKSVTVSGDTVTLSFIGKSNHRNLSVIRDKFLADVITSQKTDKNDDDPLFPDTDYQKVVGVFKKDFGYDGFTVKDVRTFVACSEAIHSLYSSTPPPPLPENNKEARKLIATRLKYCFETVSRKLNNTPKMAESSYVNPIIVDDWMKKIGGDLIMKAVIDANSVPTISQIWDRSGLSEPVNPDLYLNDDDEDGEDVLYGLPNWMNELLSEFE